MIETQPPAGIPGTWSTLTYSVSYPWHVRRLMAFADWLHRWCERRQILTRIG